MSMHLTIADSLYSFCYIVHSHIAHHCMNMLQVTNSLVDGYLECFQFICFAIIKMLL